MDKKYTLFGALNLLVAKPLTFTLGGSAVVIKKSADYAYSKSEVVRAMDVDGNVQMLKGEGTSQELLVDKAFSLFDSVKITLTADETKALEEQAKEIIDEALAKDGLTLSYDDIFSGLKASALTVKKAVIDAQ